MEAGLEHIPYGAKSHPCPPYSCCYCSSLCFFWEMLHPRSMEVTSKTMVTTSRAAVPDELWGSFEHIKSSNHSCHSRSQLDDQNQAICNLLLSISTCDHFLPLWESTKRPLGDFVCQVFDSGIDRGKSQCQHQRVWRAKGLQWVRQSSHVFSIKHTQAIKQRQLFLTQRVSWGGTV